MRVIESRPRKFGHAGRTPPSRASPSARRAPGFAERRPRRPRRASTAGPPNGPRGPFGPRAPSAPRHASRSARGLCAPRGAPSPSTACAAGRPVAVDGGSGRVVRAAFSFPHARVDGEAFAPSPCGSQNGAESRELVIEIRHIWSRSITYDRDSPFVIEIRQRLAEIPRNM